MEKILVVDDEKDNLTILDLYLKQRGYQTILSTNGKEALYIAQNELIDLIILDIMMPDMDGFFVCKSLKENPLTSEIPVIFLTARFLDKKDLIKGLNLGAIDYITKPFDEGELFARINVALKIRHIEQSLKNQRDYLNTIINSVGNDLLIINSDFTIDMVNDAFLKKRNLDLNDVIGKKCHDISFNNKEKCFKNLDFCPAQVAFQGKTAKETYELKDPSTGSVKYISISAFPFFDEEKKVKKIVEIQEDITEIVFREKELKRINLLLQNVLHHMGEGLIFVDKDGKIIMQNGIGKTFLEKAGNFENELLKGISNLSLQSFFSDDIEKTDTHTIAVDNEYFKINVKNINISDNDGLIITVNDITHELKAQEELIQSAKLVSIGELAASIAHEINNPITGIIGYSELLTLHSSMLPKKVNDITEKIVNECYRVKNIIENLLKFSRRQQIMDMSYVDLSVSLKEILPLVEASFSENNINLITNIPENLPLVYCNVGLIQQAVLNLLQNAFDAITSSNKGSQVELKVQTLENNIIISVTDNGPGIPPEFSERIFEPFFTTKKKGKGTGLGLSLIHRIVQIHKGNIKLQTSHEGTKFSIYLPTSKPEISMPIIDEKSTISEHPKQKRAIVIDDDPTIVDYLSDILLTFKYTVDEVRDAKESLKLLKNNDYDIILIDIKLPNIDGFEIYNYLLNNCPEKAEVVTFMTADISLDTREKLRKTGKPFLIKPFSFNELIETLRLT